MADPSLRPGHRRKQQSELRDWWLFRTLSLPLYWLGVYVLPSRTLRVLSVHKYRFLAYDVHEIIGLYNNDEAVEVAMTEVEQAPDLLHKRLLPARGHRVAMGEGSPVTRIVESSAPYAEEERTIIKTEQLQVHQSSWGAAVLLIYGGLQLGLIYLHFLTSTLPWWGLLMSTILLFRTQCWLRQSGFAYVLIVHSRDQYRVQGIYASEGMARLAVSGLLENEAWGKRVITGYPKFEKWDAGVSLSDDLDTETVRIIAERMYIWSTGRGCILPH